MAEQPFHLLVFPRARKIPPPMGSGFPLKKPHLPDHSRQVERLSGQLAELEQEFSRYKASVSTTVTGLEPEMALVIEIAGTIEDFKQAIEATEGLEWLGEWDVKEMQPDEDFYEINQQGDRQDKPMSGRLFLFMQNENGLRELLALWNRWEKDQILPRGKTKWRDVFSQTRRIRRWGLEETLRETGMIERWRDLRDPVKPVEEVHCQIELFYRRSPEKRKEVEANIRELLEEIKGETLSQFLDMENIGFHAVKAKLPAEQVRRLLGFLDSNANALNIHLFMFPGVMYFRPTGQSLATMGDEPGTEMEFPDGAPESPPIAAILDGVPSLEHNALRGRLLFDDPDNLSSEYQPGERRHGTAIASLVVHGELHNGQSNPLTRQVYCLPVMQPDVDARKVGKYQEHIPDEVFFEDRIERAVRRMLEGDGNIPAQAADVKIINLSICDPERPFLHTPSPWARLLDWLSWKYRVLFCVSVGNFVGDIDVETPYANFAVLLNDQKVDHTLKRIAKQLSQRRLLSPAESLNALTVGALHKDESGGYTPGQRVDLLPDDSLFSPISRFGYGFRRSVKPEILLPGGRQLYRMPATNSEQRFFPDMAVQNPGQCVASDNPQSRTTVTRGTSNATALATRGASRIYEVLADLKQQHNVQLPDNLIAVLIKTLLVHGAQQNAHAKGTLARALKNPTNSRRFKALTARYIGYGAVDVERVLNCTQQRATVLGSGEISQNQVHEYRFPLPIGLSGQEEWRRMVVTLAWFSPINPNHRNLREAKLSVQPDNKWSDVPLKLARVNSDHDQVKRGTVQHEVLEGQDQISAYRQGDHILLHVTCKADATDSLDQAIPYGLAVTLEVAETVNIPIYDQIRVQIQPPIVVGTSGSNP